MHPKRAARLLATLGLILMTAAFVLRGLSLAATIYEAPAAFAPAASPAVLPARGNFTLSADGQQVNFEQQVNASGDTAWFSMPLEGGPVGPGQESYEDTGVFLIRDTMVFVRGENGSSLISGSPAHTLITGHALAPGGQTLAFSALRALDEGGGWEGFKATPTPQPTATLAPGSAADAISISTISGQWGLYLVDTKANLTWLGDFDSLSDLAWSPNGQSLAFVARISGTDQVFTIQASGQNLRQITQDASRKSSPVWSPDGQTIAYIASVESGALSKGSATPTPLVINPTTESSDSAGDAAGQAVADSEIYLIAVNGDQNAAPRQLTHDPLREFGLAWVKTAQGPWLTYAVREPEHPQVSDLLAINPQTGQTRQVYPPLVIQSLDCPARIPAGGKGTIHIRLTNNGLGRVEVPLQLISGPHAVPVGSADQKSAPQRIENIPVQPGQIVDLDWPVSAAQGLVTHAAVQITQTGLPPMSEQHCQMRNTRLGILPNLRYLAPPVLLIAAGMLLWLPWLRQPDHGKRRSRWLWTAWAAAPVILLVLIIIESLWAG